MQLIHDKRDNNMQQEGLSVQFSSCAALKHGVNMQHWAPFCIPGKGPEKKRKRGLGKGGAAAKYCTMSDEPFEERLARLNKPMMWYLACGKPVAHQTKSFAVSHLTKQCHVVGKAHIAKQNANKEAAAKQKYEEMVAMQRPHCGSLHWAM